MKFSFQNTHMPLKINNYSKPIILLTSFTLQVYFHINILSATMKIRIQQNNIHYKHFYLI